ncbi:S1C family serine protease [Micromonospora globbae]|uniref:Serine protease n=1 Tax=Micromonospora globbae TaxID=1894969 RepID=A0A420EZK5_9ACTN|nr:trypsin-like peptidase domain-containing protein [Micromonospora globbae]RKF26144.1 serine protease [Micromonospora globbae]
MSAHAGTSVPHQSPPGASVPHQSSPGASVPHQSAPGASVPAWPGAPGVAQSAAGRVPAPAGWSPPAQGATPNAGRPDDPRGAGSPPNAGPWAPPVPAEPAPPAGAAGSAPAGPAMQPSSGPLPAGPSPLPSGPSPLPSGHSGPLPVSQGTAPAGPLPPAGPVWPAVGGAYPLAPSTPGTKARGRRWLTVVAVVVALLLAGLTGVQAYQIDRLGDRLAATDRKLAEAQSGDGARLDGLEQRAGALEKQAGATFNPEAVASAVLPSVFRVRAGQFTGTAFAVGKPAAGGGTNLFTNYHVVEAVYESGGRQVFLERTDQRFPATIVKVDKTNDIAHLRTSARFTGLAAAPEAVKSGQQIVVVGAPLGLEDTVTTGVVSALRDAQDDSGPVLQFDAPINPGNSGGPVVNGNKQVVGIATAKARDAEGIGLAVPIKVACDGFKIC